MKYPDSPYRTLYPNTGIEGFEDVMRNLQNEINKIRNVTADSIVEAMIMVLNKADNIIPIDTGALRASRFIVTNYGSVPLPRIKTERISKNDSLRRKRRARVQSEHNAIVNEALADAKKDYSDITVIAGYSAYYGLYVHEMPEGTIWSSPSARRKWLQATFMENKGEILQIISRNIKKSL